MDEDLAMAAAAVPALLADLEEWVNIDSGTDHKAGVDQVGELVRQRFARSGFATETIWESVVGDHIVARRVGRGRFRLLLIGHMDTVYPVGDVAKRPFTIRDGRAYGPGIMDMKGGILAGITALDLAGPEVLDQFASITFLCNSDEEIGSPTSTSLVRALAAAADGVLVLEPTRELRTVTAARKGVAAFTLTVEGRSAHAGVTPDSGRNAILELSHLIVALQALHKSRPTLSVNVGTVRGGGRRNVVPALAEAEFEMRAATNIVFAEGIADIEQIIAAPRTVPQTIATLQRGPTHLPLELAASMRPLHAIAAEAGEAQGLAIEFMSIGGASDGNTTGGMGVPTLDGLGLIGQHTHNPNEHITLDLIAPRLLFLVGIIRRLAQAPAWRAESDADR